MRVTVMIPTQRRLGGLAVAARSVFAQVGVDPGALELVVVDNDQVAVGPGDVDGPGREAPFPVHYVHEPRPGVAHARNAAMAKAAGALIAFLDDDEEAPAGWLAALLAAQARYEADVVFGPVRARAPAGVVRHRDYLERFFSREGPAEAGVIDHYYGCGDSLLRRAALPDPTRPVRGRAQPYRRRGRHAVRPACGRPARASPGSRRLGSGKIPCPTA
jgi:succinoglycan biosynthesis protein ExoM